MSSLDDIRKRTEGHTVERVDGFQGYYVTDDGRVFSTVPWRGMSVHELRPTWHQGYLTVRLMSQFGSRHRRTVHSLVAEAFHGPRPYGAEVRHLDGDVSNNNFSNIAYGSQQANADDRAAHGRTSRGDSHARAVELGKELAECKRLATELEAELTQLRTERDQLQRRVDTLQHGFALTQREGDPYVDRIAELSEERPVTRLTVKREGEKR